MNAEAAIQLNQQLAQGLRFVIINALVIYVLIPAADGNVVQSWHRFVKYGVPSVLIFLAGRLWIGLGDATHWIFDNLAVYCAAEERTGLPATLLADIGSNVVELSLIAFCCVWLFRRRNIRG